MLGRLFNGEGEREEAGARATVLLGDRQAEEARFREDLEDVFRVDAFAVEFSAILSRQLEEGT